MSAEPKDATTENLCNDSSSPRTSDTPLTDAVAWSPLVDHKKETFEAWKKLDGNAVWADFARSLERALAAERERAEKAEALNRDHEEVHESKRALVREIDVIINSEEGAAKQASLCDLVGQIQELVTERDEFIDSCNAYKVEVAGLQNQLRAANRKAVADSDKLLREKLDVSAQLVATQGQLAKVREELKGWNECAAAILEIIETEDFPKDELWIPTIRAHAYVIHEDTKTVLAESLTPVPTEIDQVGGVVGSACPACKGSMIDPATKTIATGAGCGLMTIRRRLAQQPLT